MADSNTQLDPRWRAAVVILVGLLAFLLYNSESSSLLRLTKSLENFPNDIAPQAASQNFLVSAKFILVYPPYTDEYASSLPEGKMPLVINVAVKPLVREASFDVGFSLKVPEDVRHAVGLPIFFVTSFGLTDVLEGADVKMNSIWYTDVFDRSSQQFQQLKQAVEPDMVVKGVYRGGVEYLIVKPQLYWRHGIDDPKELKQVSNSVDKDE